jgi:hypothetical protein
MEVRIDLRRPRPTDHVVGWIDVHPDYTTRSEPAEIIAALEAR